MSTRTESYSKVFLVVADDAFDSGHESRDGTASPKNRKCLICERVLSRCESFEHSKTICYPPAASTN